MKRNLHFFGMPAITLSTVCARAVQRWAATSRDQAVVVKSYTRERGYRVFAWISRRYGSDIYFR